MAKSAHCMKKNEKIGLKQRQSAQECTKCSEETLFSKQVSYEHSMSTLGPF